MIAKPIESIVEADLQALRSEDASPRRKLTSAKAAAHERRLGVACRPLRTASRDFPQHRR